jgi:hypothetical protein
MQIDHQLRCLFELIPDTRIFQRWCDRAGVDSLHRFVEVDLSEAPEPWYGPWSQVQVALRKADSITRDVGPTRGCAALDRLLRRPPANVQADVGVLRKLTPIVPQRTARSSQQMSAREALERLGGVSGARAVAALLTSQNGSEVTVRQVRDRFRNTGGKVVKLGAGYFATEESDLHPVLHWVEARIAQRGPENLADLISAIMERYPNGDLRAVRAWIHQQPGILTVRSGQVCLVKPAASASDPA